MRRERGKVSYSASHQRALEGSSLNMAYGNRRWVVVHEGASRKHRRKRP